MKHILRVGGVPEHFNLPWHWAAEQQLLANLEVAVQWTDYPSGTGAMMAALRDKELDIALVLTEGAVADIAKGNEARIVQTYVNTPLQWGIHVAAHSDITETTNLTGKHYAISRKGSGSHLMALVNADQNGYTITEADWVQVGNIGGAEKALTDGEADVFMWEKAMTQPLVSKGIFRRVGVCPTPWPCFVVVVRTEIIAQYAEQIAEMLRIVGQVAAELKTHSQAVEIVAQRYELPLVQTQEWHEATDWNYNAEPIAQAQIEPVAQTLFRLGIVEQMPDVQNITHKLEA